MVVALWPRLVNHIEEEDDDLELAFSCADVARKIVEKCVVFVIIIMYLHAIQLSIND